jgi:hypothetical protein
MWRAAFLTASLLACGPVSRAQGGACLGGLKPILVAGGFTGSVNCQRDQLAVRRVGEVVSRGHRFTIWAYRYQLALMCPECAIHGGRRTLVLRDGKYLGQYQTNFDEARIARGALILTPVHPPYAPGDSMRSVAVRFTAKGPSDLVHVGGEDLEFFK